MQKHKVTCKSCHGSGSLQTANGQIMGCAACQGTGQQNRAEVSPFDYVFEYTVPASGSVAISVQILSYDFLLKWLIAYTATPTDKIQVQDNNGVVWSNAPLQIQNFAGSAQLPFPLQPNLTLLKNTILTMTITGTAADTGEIVLRGINLAAAAATQ